MDWLHCNGCFHVPQNSDTRTFYLSSCAHILCNKCIKKNQSTTTPSRAEVCRACHKAATFIEINRNVPTNIQILFRAPKDLAVEYCNNLKKVMEFQHQNRSRFGKYQQHQQQKLSTYTSRLYSQSKKLHDREKAMCKEITYYKSEIAQKDSKIAKLEERLRRLEEVRKKESSRERERERTSMTPKRMDINVNNDFGSLNTNTPITTLSMNGVTMSTPIGEPFAPAPVTPVYKDSPVIAGGGIMTTPALLGIHGSSTSSSLRSDASGGINMAFRRSKSPRYSLQRSEFFDM